MMSTAFFLVACSVVTFAGREAFRRGQIFAKRLRRQLVEMQKNQ